MNGRFQYSLLKYHHRQREEWLTLGVLVFFQEQKQIKFLHPEKLGRIRTAFPDAPEKLLKAWLKSFEWKSEELLKNRDIFAEYQMDHNGNALIADHYIPKDSSALQFGSIRSSVLYTDNIKEICDNLTKLYLSVYDTEDDDHGKKGEDWLVKQYRKALKEKAPGLLTNKIIRENVVATFNNRQFDFDFSWQNHTFNLVKAVSFDLKRTDSIQRKGFQYYGQFSLIHDYAKEEEVRFDILLNRPRHSKLFGAYDKAIEDIQNIAQNINLVQTDEIEQYAQKTIEEVVQPE